MKSIVTLLLLFILNVYGSPNIYLEEGLSAYSTVSSQRMYEDTSATLSLHEAMPFLANSSLQKHSTVATKSAFWTEFSIQNSTHTPKEIIIKHPRSGLDFLDVFVFKDGVLVDSLKMGDLQPSTNRELTHRHSLFKRTLFPNETYTIISRMQSYGAYELYWTIEDVKYFTYHTSIESIAWGLFGGILLSLIFYNLSFFFHLKEKAFFIYSIHVFCMLWHQYAVNGILYQYFTGINLKFLTVTVWVFPYISFCSLFLFAYYFFKLNGTFLGKIFIAWSFFAGMIALFYLFALQNMALLYSANHLTPVTLASLLLIVVGALWMLYKRVLGAVYFFIGQAIYVGCAIYSFNILSAYAEIREFSWLILPFGILCDSLLLSFALGQKVRHIKEENQKHQNVILEQARFYTIGQTVGNVTHQWKTPIAQLASQFMFLQATFAHRKEVFLDEFEKTMPKIVDSMNYMQESMTLFNDFYKLSHIKTFFNPLQEMETIRKILETKLILNAIDLRVHSDIDSLYTHKNALMNAIMILVENSVEALVEKKVDTRSIEVAFKKENSSCVKITIQDNAGTLEAKAFDMLFIKPSSTKTENFGLGLSIVKTLVEEKLEGTISHSNTSAGLLFCITLDVS